MVFAGGPLESGATGLDPDNSDTEELKAAYIREGRACKAMLTA